MLTPDFVKLIAGYASGVIVIFGLIIYLRAILQGKVRSNKVTWGVWVIVTGMLCVSYYQSVGLVSTIWVSVGYFIGTGLIFIFLVVYTGTEAWTWLEKACIISLIPIIFVWIIFNSPLLALTLTMLVDILGSIPLIRTIYADQRSEYGPAWAIGFIANVLNLFAVERWDYANAAYPLYLTFLTLTLTSLIYFPRFLKSRPKQESAIESL